MNPDDIPVYLFTGFLESGKTKFIRETLEDDRFNDGQGKILIIQCEEGEEEIDTDAFPNVAVEIIEDKEHLNPVYFNTLVKRHEPMGIMIEYNGMWMLQDLFGAMPRNWVIYQEFSFADSNTFESYNTNMRQLTFDKLNTCDCMIFNRWDDSMDQMMFHKIVRAVSRRADIMYEYPDGNAFPDEIEDPLPFDVNAPVIEVKDSDFAIWYRDLDEKMDEYDGKTVKVKFVSANSSRLPKGIIVLGRPVMSCCVDDIQHAGLACEYKGKKPEAGNWFIATAKIVIKRSEAYDNKKGPVLDIKKLEPCDPPEQPVATFY